MNPTPMASTLPPSYFAPPSPLFEKDHNTHTQFQFCTFLHSVQFRDAENKVYKRMRARQRYIEREGNRDRIKSGENGGMQR